VLLTSEEPVVEQFLNGRRLGPIGMSEEKDAATMAREQADVDAGHTDGGVDEDISGIIPQLQPTPGLPERTGARRRQDRVMRILHTLGSRAQQAIVDGLAPQERVRYGVGRTAEFAVPIPDADVGDLGTGPEPEAERLTGTVPLPHREPGIYQDQFGVPQPGPRHREGF
ncbi:MAG TPA: ABC transporter ATP-binding protein, partial [Pseudonocardiaceae bacterium]|nr:ABC transporter ATP-binding protein [Pseudonocardiaceae bacterium]